MEGKMNNGLSQKFNTIQLCMSIIIIKYFPSIECFESEVYDDLRLTKSM